MKKQNIIIKRTFYGYTSKELFEQFEWNADPDGYALINFPVVSSQKIKNDYSVKVSIQIIKKIPK